VCILGVHVKMPLHGAWFGEPGSCRAVSHVNGSAQQNLAFFVIIIPGYIISGHSDELLYSQ